MRSPISKSRLLEVVRFSRRLLRSDFVRQSFLVFCGSTLVNVLGYAFHFAVSRRVGVVQYGVVSALNAAFAISAALAGIFATVVVKYVAELHAAGDNAKVTAFVRKLIVVCFAGSAAVVLAGLAIAPRIADFLHVPDVRVVAIDMFVIGLTFASAPLRSVFAGLEEFVTFSVLAAIESIVRAICGIGLVYLGFGVTGAFAGWSIGSVCAVLGTAAVLLRRFKAAALPVPLHIDVRRLVFTTANVGVATIVLTIIGYGDVLVVKHFADPATAGLYGALSLSGKILFFFVAFVPTVLLPKASRLALGGRSAMPVFLQAMAVVAAVSAAGLVVYGFAPGVIVTALAGPSFAAAAPFVFSYGIAMVALAALSVVVAFKIGLHRFDFIVPLGLVAAGEIAGISLHHATLRDVISVLIAGNVVALASSLYRIDASVVARRPARPAEGVA